MSRPVQVFVSIVILTILFVMPETTRAVEVDPYLNNSLRFGLYFQYDRDTTKNKISSFENLRTSFEQQYALDALGHIVSRWLMTYDTGLHYSRKTFDAGQTKTTNNTWYYYLSTTILPKTNIPLTTYFNNTRYTSTSAGSDTWRNKFTYGLNWYGTFRKLPKTIFTLKTDHHTDDRTHGVDTEYDLTLQKKIGITDNKLENEYNVYENRTAGTSTSQFSTNFINKTDISRTTKLSVSAAAAKADQGGGSSSSVIGMNTSLNSTPSRIFSHNHAYSFVSVETDGSNENSSERHYYAGAMRYNISDRITSSANVSLATDKNNTLTSSRDSDSITAGANISYRATDHLSLTESVSYSQQSSTSIDTANTALDDRTDFRLTSTASYSNNYSWASFGASGSLGYNETQSDIYEDGRGLEQSVSSNLSGINVVPLLLLNTSGSWSSSRSSVGTLNRSTSYSFSAQNRAFNRYVELSSSYNFTTSESKAVSSDTKKTKIDFSASTNYIQSLPIRYRIDYNKFSDFFSGYTTSLDKVFTISHERIFLRGNLASNFYHATNESTFKEGEQNTTTRLFKTTYQRGLTMNSFWDLELLWSHKEADESEEDSKSIKNKLVYQLRSWLLTAEYTYIDRAFQNSETVETRLMLTAARSFGFYWR